MIKSSIHVILLLIILPTYQIIFAQSSISDSPENMFFKPDTIPPSEFPFTQKFNFNYSSLLGVNGGTVGAIYFEGKYYFNRWAANECYLLSVNADGSPDSTNIELITSQVIGIRDMTIAPDESGELFLWGGNGSEILFKMDAQLNVISQYSIPGASFRAIAWDPVTGGFWNANFDGQSKCYDTLGTLLATSANGSNIPAKYGAAFTSSNQLPGTNSVWWWSQTSESGLLTQIELDTDSILAAYLFNSGNLAGGAEVCEINEEWVLLLNFQNVSLCGYILGPVTGVNENPILVHNFELLQNYPNPFNPSTKISYSLKESGFVSLKVYDILGNEITKLVNTKQQAGNHSVDFNAVNLPSGVYIYTLQVNGFTNSKKMLLLK